ncbi:hypothetical protein [Caulobacter sp. S45]|jgi:hypothetical protein|uniref:hypothetical protein n=1 Tax=Caulobacter sp. S45 TaxID=1641861 RepID=UPI00131EBA69|nr:hypothetical protein [Caulobacter sp. S45]
MIAGSARATTMREGAYRIAAPNSRPRNIMVVALEAGAARLLAHLAEGVWHRVSFRSSVWLQDIPNPQSGTLDKWWDVVAGHAEDLVSEIAASDLVIMVTTAGDPTTGASVIGEACVEHAVKTSGIVIRGSMASPDVLSQSLMELRPWTQTLSVIGESDMIVDMIHALGA